jgi:hypothetical protein
MDHVKPATDIHIQKRMEKVHLIGRHMHALRVNKKIVQDKIKYNTSGPIATLIKSEANTKIKHPLHKPLGLN